MLLFHNMDQLFKLPTQEFAVKVGILQAVVVQIIALLLLFVIVMRQDGPFMAQVVNTLEVIALGNAGVGALVGGMHVLRNNSPELQIPTIAPDAPRAAAGASTSTGA